MSSSSYGPRGRAKKPTPFITPSRIIVFGLLAVVLVLLVIDVAARTSASSAYEEIDKYRLSADQANNNTENRIDGKRVREIVGKEPSRPLDVSRGIMFEDYTWGGLFNTYRVRVYYHDPTLARIMDAELNPDVSMDGQ